MPNPSALVYRDPRERLLVRRRELERALAKHLAALRSGGKANAHRVARITAGILSSAGALLLALYVLSYWIHFGAPWFLTEILLGAVLLAAPAYALAYAIMRARQRIELRRLQRPAPDLVAEVTRLESIHSAHPAAPCKPSRERASVGWPLTAIALLGPLTIHFVVLQFFQSLGSLLTRREMRGADFGFWIALSYLIVGHCHLVLAFLSWRFAHRLSRTPVSELRRLRGWGALAWTTVFASVSVLVLLITLGSLSPSMALLGGIEAVILVCLTGLVFIPATFAWMRRVIERERRALECEG
jgi:hypothetical protein